jgi:hypothetical protein
MLGNQSSGYFPAIPYVHDDPDIVPRIIRGRDRPYEESYTSKVTGRMFVGESIGIDHEIDAALQSSKTNSMPVEKYNLAEVPYFFADADVLRGIRPIPKTFRIRYMRVSSGSLVTTELPAELIVGDANVSFLSTLRAFPMFTTNVLLAPWADAEERVFAALGLTPADKVKAASSVRVHLNNFKLGLITGAQFDDDEVLAVAKVLSGLT